MGVHFMRIGVYRMNDIEKAIEILKEQYTTVSKCLSIKEATEQNTAIN